MKKIILLAFFLLQAHAQDNFLSSNIKQNGYSNYLQFNKVSIYNQYGLSYYNAAKYSEALDAFSQALDILNTIDGLDKNASMPLAQIHGNIGNIYSSLGDSVNAIKHLQLSLEIKKNLAPKLSNDPRYIDSLSISYSSIGILYGRLGNFIKAKNYLDKALEISSKIDGSANLKKANIFNSIGTNYQMSGDLDNALKFKLMALEIRKNTHEDNMIAISSLNVASTYRELKDFDTALKYIDSALDNYKSKYGDENIGTASAYYAKGLTYYTMGRYKEATNYFRPAEKVFSEAHTENHPDVISVRLKLASSNYNIENLEDAYSYYNKVISHVFYRLSTISGAFDQQSSELYLKSNYKNLLGFFDASFKIHALKPDTNEILPFQYWLNLKGSLNDYDNLLISLKDRAQDENISKQIDSLSILRRSLAKHLQTPPPSVAQKASYEATAKELEEKIAASETALASKIEAFKAEIGLKNISIKDVAKLLRPNELYIDFAMTDEAYYAFTLDSQENVNFLKLEGNKSQIDIAIADFRADIDFIIKDKNGVLTKEDESRLIAQSKAKLSKLYEIVYKPIESLAKDKNKLIISPDGALNIIPFEVLYFDSKYLVESKEIAYTPSAKEYLRIERLKEAKNKVNNETIIFSNPDYNLKNQQNQTQSSDDADLPKLRNFQVLKALSKMSFEPLVGSKVEAENIKRVSKNPKAIIIDGADSSEKKLLNIKSPKILHLSTHGFFIDDDLIQNPLLKSGLALAGANTSLIYGNDDGIVTALKLSGMDLRQTDLVVLSACDTGRGEIKAGNGVAGLNKAFFNAGAKNVVMSLWSVADKETTELMIKFYSKNQKEAYASALRDTKIEMIKQQRHPFYWAAFVLSGGK